MTTNYYLVYKREIRRLLAKTGASGGWEISFTKREDLDGALARCTTCMGERWVRFAFNSKHPANRSHSAVKRAARHEFGHFVLNRMERLAESRFVTEREIEEESEAIARIFEKLG